MLPDNLLINRPAPAEISSLAEKQFEDSQPLFAVVSDLDINSDYGSGAVYVSADKIVAVGGGIAGDCISLDFASIDEITVKRMYGNAVLKVKTVGGSTMDILRFTFACADICDAAADFVTKVKAGESVESRLAAVEAVYRNLRSFCPRCGRKLAYPGAECLNCSGKGKLLSSMMHYIRPYFGKLVFCIFLSIVTTAAALVPVPVVVFCSRFFGKKIGPMYRRLWRRGVAISSILSDTIPGIRIVKSFSREKKTIDRFGRHIDDWMQEDKRAAKVSAIFPAAITFLITCGSVIIWLVGGEMVIKTPDKLSLGVLVSFISYTSMFYNPVNFFANLNDSYQNAIASAEKVMEIVNAEPEHDFGAGKELENIDGRIEFRNVNFSFDRSKKVLNDINFIIEPGDVVGIVGTTGSGKSTLINLLMRFYDDYDGEILVDGVDIRDIDMAYYRSQIGYVQQEPMMFHDTIFNNIAYSVPGAHPEQIINAADIANAHGFISRLPDAYDTMLGERGVGLSGGEKQRLSIARAVLKNPGILIFDEATSAVDSETEKLIQDAIDRLIRGRTTLMIAHRLSTLRKANKIIVVDKGNIIEFGSPDELMALKGKYYKLIKIQSMSEQAEAERAAENFE